MSTLAPPSPPTGDATGVPRRLPVQRRSETTVARIETAARRVLATVGRDRFTTAQVAAEAGVSIGSVYTYFTDKVDLLDRVWPDRGDTYLVPAPDVDS